MKKARLEKKQHGHFWCLLGILLLLIMTRYAFQVDLPRVIFLAVIGMIVLFGDQDEIAAMIMCCVPLHESIDFFYALVICTGVYVFKFYRKIRLGQSVLLVLLIIVWELLHCLQSTFSVIELIGSVIPFIVLAVMMASDAEHLDYPFIVRAMAWTTFGVNLTLLMRVLYFSGFNFAAAIVGLRRLGSDTHSGIENAAVSGGQINPNTLGIVTVLVSSGLMQIRSMKRGRTSDMILMCAIIMLAALSTSRTYLVCLVLMIILLIFSEKGGIRRKMQLLAVICVAVIAVVFLLSVFFTDTFEYYISRFSEADITTGRDDLMIQYHRFIVENPKVLGFGIGLQDFGNRLIQYYRVAENVPHNAMQELIIAWGIPGVILFMMLFFCMYWDSSVRNKNQSLVNMIPLIIILIKGMAGQILTSYYTMLALSYVYLSLCADLRPKSEETYILPNPNDSERIRV